VRTLLQLYPEDAPKRHAPIVAARDWLREREVELVLADEKVVPADRDHYADALELPPPDDTALVLERLRQFARRHSIAGLIAQSEWAAPAGSLLARELGLRGPSIAATLACLAKPATRAALARAGVPQPDYAVVEDAAGVRRFAASNGFPLLLKGCTSTMARLVTLVPTADAIEGAVASLRARLTDAPDVRRLRSFADAARLELGLDPTRLFLVEACAEGDPLEADGFVSDGKPFSFGVLEQVRSRSPFHHYMQGYLLPADRAAADLDRIERTAERALAAVGLDQTGFSVELHEDPSRGGVARVIEINGRLGEDDGLHRLFERASGIDPFRAAVEIALGERPRLVRAKDRPAVAIAYRSSFDDALVTSVPAAPELAALAAQGLEAGLSVRPGTTMHAPPHPATFPHLAWVLASDPSSSRAAFARAREHVEGLRFTLVQSPAP
jgi:biotin carboxylase